MEETEETLAELVESNFLKCSSCCHDYQSPRLLPCLHSLCEECIQKLPRQTSSIADDQKSSENLPNGNVIERFSCPVCVSSISLPEGGGGTFQSNAFLQDLCQLYKYKHDKDRKCDYCTFAGKTVDAVSLCLNCHDDMCGDCQEAHHKTKITRNHQVVPYEQIRNGLYDQDIREHQSLKCEEHENNSLTSFCTDCEALLCPKCQTPEHGGHNVVDLDNALPKYSKQIKGLISSIKTRLPSIQNYCEFLEKYAENLDQTKQQLLTDTQTQADSLHSMIDECKNKLQQEIKETCETEMDQAKDKLKNLQVASGSLHNNAYFLNQLMAHGKPEEVLAMHREITTRLTQLIKMQLDGLTSKLRIGFLPGASTEQNLQTLFGKLSNDMVPIGKSESTQLAGDELKITSMLPNVKNTAEFLLAFDSEGTDENRDIWPTGMSVTKKDNIVIVDRDNKKIKIFDSVGKLLKEFTGENDNKIGIPFDVTVLENDTVAVTDYEQENIKVFTQDGNHVLTISGFFKHPRGITTNSKGEILVVDCRQQRITVHDPRSGNLIKTIEAEDQKGNKVLVDPYYISTTHEDNILVTDTAAPNIKVFNMEGRYIAEYGTYGIKEQQILQPFGICVDEYGYIFVADNQNHRIHLLNPDGKLNKFLLTKSNSIWHPMAVNISKKGFFMVSEALGKIRLYKYL
ncbi:E3 ubiquitin-protein ligase TRIM71-like [Ostrea edulis]|uniref:E3 ubiquitin-protein ligase TRIM71-like n=1 Tax=Ostrea edulis TaxID=37623 RepID=UPI0024AFC95D|nr:E3 ubiquitin-protein ligase TRIM71-like [Ostrea edulis]XP_048775681.2 E3 ubiquitin-protein ligase TRIM71-like [Ostrea edulis]